MSSSDGIPFGFGTYGTKTGGCIVGQVYKQGDTGKEFRFCQAHTAAVGNTLTTITQYSVVVQVGATTWGIATDDVSAGLAPNNPVPLGFATSACPISTSSTTYYFWAQTRGIIHTVSDGNIGSWTTTKASVPTNGDNDTVAGDALITATTTDAATNRVAAATGLNKAQYCGIALASEAASLLPGVFADLS